MAFQHGLSGLSAASANLDVIGNNIANSNTIGFKQSQAQFSDVYANALNGAGNNQVGIGTKVSDIAQKFTQGSISTSNNPLDIAINGGGFFRMNDNGAITYSRSGQFHLDNNGFIVNSDNLKLTGYQTDSTGQIVPTAPTNLRLSTADLQPQPTTTFSSGFNLDSRTAVPVPLPPFDATNPATFANSTSGSIFDSLGGSHVMTLFFQKIGSGTWNAYATVDGAVTPAGLPDGVDLGTGPGNPLTLNFDTNGALIPPATPTTASIDLAAIAANLGTVNDATTPLDFTLNLNNATQFGADFSVNSLNQDGFTSGRLAGFDVAEDGIIRGNFTNGETQVLGQVVLANFSNVQGLAPIGRNQWVETARSGQPLVGAPRSGTLGELQSSANEDSNVDLTTELVNMITAQRIYQANAKTIETQDAVLQTLVNL